jgi:hypothetical protein
MIRHTVVFTLKHAAGSAEEGALPARCQGAGRHSGRRKVRAIAPGQPQERLRLRLLDGIRRQAAYSGYNDHPDHVAFVRDRWIPEVARFLEIDYVAL